MGDMAADVSMTKKGFGEMAITATLAGPVFNTLVGMSLSNFASYATNGANETGATAGFFDSYLKLYYRKLNLPDNRQNGKYGDFDYNSVLPIIIIGSELSVIGLVFVNAMINHFKLRFKTQVISMGLYVVTITALVIFMITQKEKLV